MTCANAKEKEGSFKTCDSICESSCSPKQQEQELASQTTNLGYKTSQLTWGTETQHDNTIETTIEVSILTRYGGPP